MAEDQGWQWPINSRKAHYFVGGDSLCGRWMFWGRQEDQPQEMSEQPNADDCKECWRKAAKRQGLAPARRWAAVMDAGRDSRGRKRTAYYRLTDDTEAGYSFGVVAPLINGEWRAHGCSDRRRGHAHQGRVSLGEFDTRRAAEQAVESWAARHHAEAQK